MKKQWDGLYESAKEIVPEHLLDFFLMGDYDERLEARREILRRLHAYENFVDRQNKTNKE